MKMTRKNYVIKRLVSFMLAFSMIFAMIPVTVFADDTNNSTQMIYIGGNELTVPMEDASYWKYQEADGTITTCTKEEANILINAEARYGLDPASKIYVQLIKVHIKARGGSDDYLNAGIYSPGMEVNLRINGDCSITGSRYGIYARNVQVVPRDTAAELTITADSSLAPAGVDITQACALYSTGSNKIEMGCEYKDFSVILRSDTNTTMKGGGAFKFNATKKSILTGPNMDGSNATEYFPDENGNFHLGDMSRVKYQEYKAGAWIFDRAEITGATLKFNAGDAPVFTAQVVTGDQDKYKILAEQWSEVDESGNTVKWCSSRQYENPEDESRLLKTFEAGKTYYYDVTLSRGDYFNSFAERTQVIINGKSFMTTNEMSGGGYPTIRARKLISMTVPKEIKKIEVANATLSYKAGDAPKATATLTGKDTADYRIAYEYWKEMEKQDDGSLVPVRFWYSDATENARLTDDKKITTFEKGKTYVYSIKLKTVNENYFADVDTGLTMTLNGEAVDTSKITVGEGCDSLYAMELKTMQPTVAQSTYKFLEGENASWTQGGNGTLRFRVNGEISKFTGVKVDGTLLSTDQYTVKSGSTIITLKSGYLKGLSVGTHKITVIYTDGECSADFEIKRATGGTTTEATTEDRENTTEATTEGGKDTTEATTESGTDTTAAASDSGAGTTATANVPKTGDEGHPWMYMILLVIACGGMAGCSVYDRITLRRK